MWESIILLLPLPPAVPALLQYDCTSIAQDTTHPRHPFYVSHTIYEIENFNIVYKPSSSGRDESVRNFKFGFLQ